MAFQMKPEVEAMISSPARFVDGLLRIDATAPHPRTWLGGKEGNSCSMLRKIVKKHGEWTA
jgi:hypothetical protein